MPIRFGLCQELFEDRPWDAQCATMAELGYEGVEIAPFSFAERATDLSTSARNNIRSVSEAAGLEVIGLHWLLAKTTGFHLTSPDAEIRRATSDYLSALANLCADLGGKILVLGSPAQRNFEKSFSRAAATECAIDVLTAALPACEARGVTIALEPLTPKETNFMNTCAEASDIIHSVNSPALRLHQDVKAMLGGENESIPALISEFAAETVHFHANDSNLLGPGMGETDFIPIFKALLDSNYDGFVSVEVFDYKPGADLIARQSIETMRASLNAAQSL